MKGKLYRYISIIILFLALIPIASAADIISGSDCQAISAKTNKDFTESLQAVSCSLVDIISKQNIRNGIFVLLLFLMIYGVVIAGLSQAGNTFKKDDQNINKAGKLIAISVAMIAVFALLQPVEGETTDETVSVAERINQTLQGISDILSTIIIIGIGVLAYKLFNNSELFGENISFPMTIIILGLAMQTFFSNIWFNVLSWSLLAIGILQLGLKITGRSNTEEKIFGDAASGWSSGGGSSSEKKIDPKSIEKQLEKEEKEKKDLKEYKEKIERVFRTKKSIDDNMFDNKRQKDEKRNWEQIEKNALADLETLHLTIQATREALKKKTNGVNKVTPEDLFKWTRQEAELKNKIEEYKEQIEEYKETIDEVQEISKNINEITIKDKSDVDKIEGLYNKLEGKKQDYENAISKQERRKLRNKLVNSKNKYQQTLTAMNTCL